MLHSGNFRPPMSHLGPPQAPVAYVPAARYWRDAGPNQTGAAGNDQARDHHTDP